jgi:hypothetical protein
MAIVALFYILQRAQTTVFQYDRHTEFEDSILNGTDVIPTSVCWKLLVTGNGQV